VRAVMEIAANLRRADGGPPQCVHYE